MPGRAFLGGKCQVCVTILYMLRSAADAALLIFFTPQRSSRTIQLPFNHHSTTIQGVHQHLSAKIRPILSISFTIVHLPSIGDNTIKFLCGGWFDEESGVYSYVGTVGLGEEYQMNI